MYKFWTHQPPGSSSVEIRWPLSLFFINRNDSIPSQHYIVDDSLNRCFECTKMQLLQSMCESSLALAWWRGNCIPQLSFFLSWKTTGKQMVVYYSKFTVPRYSNGRVGTCSVSLEKGATICLYMLHAQNNFCWIRLILKHPYNRLLFTFRLIRLNSRFIICHDIVNMFRSNAFVFLRLLATNRCDDRFFFNDWQIVFAQT